MSGEKAEGVDGRIPTWNGDWTTYSEYVLRCELKADSIKEEEKPLLGPRLAGNLTGRAFDCMVDIDRSQLRKEDGWRYLLEFLESKRGKEKVDVLGDMFTEFFLKKDSHRKEGEDLADYEPRFRQLVRRLDKAVAETGTQGKIPPELYGWFLLNVYMKMDASDMANVRGKADSYKLDDILTALKKMWSGGGLSLRDAERKKTRGSGTFVAEEVDSEGHQVFGAEDEEDGEDEDLQFAETTAWYQESLEALLEEPEDVQILANFKEARRAVEQARNSRGFYPVKNPNARNTRSGSNGGGKGDRKGYGGSAEASHANKICLRCGKMGHIARNCTQKPNFRRDASTPSGSKVTFAGLVVSSADRSPSLELLTHVGMLFDESVWSHDEIFTVQESALRGCAILDSGASDNIVGIDTLQDMADVLEELGYQPAHEIHMDYSVQKRFTFGNCQSDAAIGKAYVAVGLFGKEWELPVYVVEGNTPFLLSARFLADLNVSINFRTGKAVFRKLGPEQNAWLPPHDSSHLVSWKQEA